MSFTGKTVIVTGATSGIGRAAAELFASEGASVVAVGRKTDELAETAALVQKAGGQAATCAVDLTSDEGPAKVVDTAIQAFGQIDVLVNAAGIIAGAPLETTTDELWDSMMAVNVRAPFRLMRAALPHLKARKGTVVNVSSVNGLRSFPNVLAYNVSKAAVDHLTRCAAIEMAPLGVRINAVSPSIARHKFLEKTSSSDLLDRLSEGEAFGRAAEPWEIAATIAFLASDYSSYLTGEVISVSSQRA